MPIRIAFEIGHKVTLKAKASSEGFTHDWELFVRGCDGSDISSFVEKIVFLLHESFPKPRRSKWPLQLFSIDDKYFRFAQFSIFLNSF